MSSDAIPWAKNGWEGYIADHDGTPIGMLVLRARKGDRVLQTRPLTPEQIQDFDPDVYWGHQSKGADMNTTPFPSATKENQP